MTVKLTPRQEMANGLLASDASHIMLYGGSRSGKTFVLTRAVIVRALMAPKSRHVVLRYRFNHVKSSIIRDTLPKVIDLCWPGLWDRSKLDKSDWFLSLPNGSEIWFGGIDDKERTEKILGQEFSTIYMNECSQIPWASRNMAITRLAQNVGLRLKAYYDCNPPGKAHWTYRVFVEKRDPDTRQALRNPENFAALVMNPDHNRENLSSAYLDELSGMSARMRERFEFGRFADVGDSALWSVELLDQQRAGDRLPDMQRVVIAVDPSGCSGEEDIRSDEVGIVVVGLGVDGKGYVLEDLSGRMGPAKWGAVVASAFDRHQADRVVAEANFGGAMVSEIIRAARPGTPFREVRASRGKVVRAEPIAALFEQQKVWMAGTFADLEDQLCAMTTNGYTGSKSPDRADAMVWGISDLFPSLTKKDDAFIALPKVHVGYSTMKGRR